MEDKEVVRYEKALAEYSITPAKVQEMAKEYESLHVVPGDIKSYKAVHAAKMVLTRVRTGVDKRRKELGVDAYAWIKTKDGAAKDLLEPIIPLEDRFKEEMAQEDARIEKIETDRVDGIKAKIEAIRFNMMQAQGKDSTTLSIMLDNISTIPIDEFYAEFQDEARAALDEVKSFIQQAHGERVTFEKEEAARKAESERLERVRKAQEAEAARLKAIADEQEATRKEQEDAARKEREAIEEEKRKIQAEKDKIEAAKKAEADRIAREAFEKQALENARIKAEQEAKEAAERKEKNRIAKAEAEKAEKDRQEALRPDIDKLIDFSNDIMMMPKRPDVKDKNAIEILVGANKMIQKTSQWIRKQIEVL